MIAYYYVLCLLLNKIVVNGRVGSEVGWSWVGAPSDTFLFFNDVFLIRILRTVTSAERLGGGWFGAMMATQHYYFSLSLTLDGATCQP